MSDEKTLAESFIGYQTDMRCLRALDLAPRVVSYSEVYVVSKPIYAFGRLHIPYGLEQGLATCATIGKDPLGIICAELDRSGVTDSKRRMINYLGAYAADVSVHVFADQLGFSSVAMVDGARIAEVVFGEEVQAARAAIAEISNRSPEFIESMSGVMRF